MKTWNVYAKDKDGFWDIIRTVKSATKPTAKRGERVAQNRGYTINTDQPFDARLAFPAAHGLSKRKGL